MMASDDLYLGDLRYFWRCAASAFSAASASLAPCVWAVDLLAEEGQPALRHAALSIRLKRERASAPFISVSDQTDQLLALFMKWHWQLSAGSDTDTGSTLNRRRILISVMGSAQDFQLTPDLMTVFQKGLVGAANKASAVFFAGGTNAGGLLIGAAFEEAGVKAPLVGVAPLPRSASATYS